MLKFVVCVTCGAAFLQSLQKTVSTLKLLNIIIDEFNLLLMDFGGSFTTLFHLEIFVSTEKLLNITILLMNFSQYE